MSNYSNKTAANSYYSAGLTNKLQTDLLYLASDMPMPRVQKLLFSGSYLFKTQATYAFATKAHFLHNKPEPLFQQYLKRNYVSAKQRFYMKISLTPTQKLLLVVICFALAVVGFMIKLPSAFRHADKELHAAFYFLAAALLNFLFAGTKLVKHAAIFLGLYLFGVAIEYAQGYSNRFYRVRIHGRFDPEDLQWNLKGLIAFSALWLLYALVKLVYKTAINKDNSEPLPRNLKP